MQLGVSFPQDQTMDDPAAVRDFAQAVEGLGFDYLTALDHVLGADTTNRPGWAGPYSNENITREPMVLLGYIAACTTRLRLGTSVVILPQRQTALVAKQAAEIDVLSGGRMMLGVGVGWNDVEFEALNEDFHNRGRRIEEQIAVLRALWTQKTVSFTGEWHQIPEAGLNPLPVQRPIPIWMGGSVERAIRRIAALADGWLPSSRSVDEFTQTLERFRGYAREAGPIQRRSTLPPAWAWQTAPRRTGQGPKSSGPSWGLPTWASAPRVPRRPRLTSTSSYCSASSRRWAEVAAHLHSA